MSAKRNNRTKRDFVLPEPDTLHGAALRGDEEVLGRLLRRGEDVNAYDWRGHTPLHWAARGAEDAVVPMLLGAGADPKSQCRCCGATPLHLAARAGFPTRVGQLLSAGADPDARTVCGETPLLFLVRPDPESGALPRGVRAGPADPPDEWLTPLREDARQGRIGSAELLLAAGADPNAQDESGFTSLFLAALSEERVAELLIARGADVNAAGKLSITPLHIAVMENRCALARRLLEREASWRLALAEAASEEMIDLLRRHGVQ